MSDLDEGQVCGVDGCAPARENPVLQELIPLFELSVVSDAICPWCYVGKRRLEKALAAIPEAKRIRIAWRPFQLNPDMPKAGISRREYRIRKFGSWEHSLRLDAQLTEAGAGEGLDFRYDLALRTPNTFDAHRLIWLAGREGVQDAIVEALFRAYFSQGRDIGDRGALADIAADAGLTRAHVLAFLESDAEAAEVAAEEDIARRAGISGVPAFIAGGRVLFTGAQPPQTIESVLRRLIGAFAAV